MRMWTFAVLCIGACGWLSAEVLADPPTSWDVAYGIHSTPTDPNSSVTFVVTLLLTRHSLQGNSIGWSVDTLRIEQKSTLGTATGCWERSAPAVSTADGLWWTQHADPNNPQMSEFTLPPRLNGTATAQDPNDPDLSYDLAGSTYSGRSPYSVTAGLDYSFTLEGDPNPIGDGSDEPVEVTRSGSN